MNINQISNYLYPGKDINNKKERENLIEKDNFLKNQFNKYDYFTGSKPKKNNNDKPLNYFPESNKRYIILDTETTGLSHNDDLISISAIEIINKQITGIMFNAYFHPRKTNNSTYLYFIEDYAHERINNAKNSMKDFIRFLGDSMIISHNSRFDLMFINKELRNLNMKEIPLSNTVCSLITARKWRNIGVYDNNMKLTVSDLCKYYGINVNNKDFHHGIVDSYVLGRVICKMWDHQDVILKQNDFKNNYFKDDNEDFWDFFYEDDYDIQENNELNFHYNNINNNENDKYKNEKNIKNNNLEDNNKKKNNNNNKNKDKNNNNKNKDNNNNKNKDNNNNKNNDNNNNKNNDNDNNNNNNSKKKSKSHKQKEIQVQVQNNNNIEPKEEKIKKDNNNINKKIMKNENEDLNIIQNGISNININSEKNIINEENKYLKMINQIRNIEEKNEKEKEKEKEKENNQKNRYYLRDRKKINYKEEEDEEEEIPKKKTKEKKIK